MKKKSTWCWWLVPILVLSLGLGACSTASNATNTAAETEIPPEVDVKQLMKDADNGVVVTMVNADSPAEKVGMQKGDVILMVGDQEVNNVDDLRTALESYKEGDKVQVAVRRGDELLMKTVELGAGPNRAYLGASVCCGGTMLAVREGGLFGGSAQAVILDVTPGSPAEKAGLEMGDYIVSVDGQDIALDTDLGAVIQAYQPGDTLALEISREGEDQEVKVTLGENPASAGTAYLGVQYQMLPGMRLVVRGDLPGFQFQFVPGERGRFRNVPPFMFNMPFRMHEDGSFTLSGDLSGIFVASVQEGSPAEDAGLEVHDVITKLDGEEIAGLEEFTQAIAAHAPGDKVTLTLARSGQEDQLEITVTLGEHPDQEGAGYLGITLGGMIVTKPVDGDGEDSQQPDSFHFHMDDFHHFGFPFGNDV
jgi:S1-C subfamily serine protease